jgi:methylamine---glutamate N-methyltransferase subunit C
VTAVPTDCSPMADHARPAAGSLTADGFPAEQVRARARHGAACAFPPVDSYGTALLGAQPAGPTADLLESLRISPPIFMPQRLEKLIELAREPMYGDVETDTVIGGFSAPLPLFVSALGSTSVASATRAEALGRQAARLGLPMVIGENIVPSTGYRRGEDQAARSLLSRVLAYCEELPDGWGGLAIQQSTEDADAEVWNLVYSDPAALPLLESGRLAFELKVGQGAKPGLGGMTVLPSAAARAPSNVFAVDPIFGADAGAVMRTASPGTFTEEILRQQIRLMRNNFPRAKVWVKLHPGRDVGHAYAVAVAAGADAVTVDGAEGGSGWAPNSFLAHVGLPLGECLLRTDARRGCLLATGRMWEGSRVVKSLALGARAAGLGRAAFLAVDEDPEQGLVRLVECLALELKLLVSSLGKYRPGDLAREDLWPLPTAAVTAAEQIAIG